jgi:PAS domain S-box-containing protein
LFAEYSAEAGFSCQSPGERPVLSQAIVLDGREIGTLLLFYDVGELYGRVQLFGSIVFGIFLLASTVAFLLSNRLRDAIVIPVTRLVSATTAVAETGDYHIRAQKMSGDELGVLVDRFNEMLQRIETRDAEVKAALHAVENERSRFQFMAESMPQKIFTAAPEGGITYLNQQWIAFSGSSLEEIMGWRWTKLVHPEDVQAHVQEWERCIGSGEPFMFQQRFRRADGKYRWHLSRAHAMRDENGAITMWIGSNTDIHEQKEKEEELRRANEDLQQFAYSASHDLQEPIRNVAVFSEIVARRYQQALDPEGVQLLGFLKEGAHRLGALVDDLLAYTLASKVELSGSSANGSEVLRKVLTTLAEPIRAANATLTADELPIVQMGDVHLQQVLQNLIGNALKYRSEEPPRIHVSARKNGVVWCFSVADNGIGIETSV